MALGQFKTPLVIGCAAFVAAMAVGEIVVRLVVSRAEIAADNHILVQASTVRSAIEAELNSTVFLAIGLSAYLALDPVLDGETVDQMLGTVYRQGRNIRNIGLAPNNRLDFIYPLEGNRAAIGLEFEKNPAQWPDVKKAIDARETVIVGPIALIQGGYGVVSRTPVFRQDESYWGVVSTVIDMDAMLQSAAEIVPEGTARWAFRTKSSQAGVPDYTYGDVRLLESSYIMQFATLRGNVWEIAVAPQTDSGITAPQHLALRGLNLVVSAIVAVLLFLVVRERVLISHLADHDALTGLPNRRLLFERLEQRVVLSRRYKYSFCIIFMDLDGFKPINDTYGHHVGDAVLREIACRMCGGVRASDTVARIGGDEFVVMLPDTQEVEGARALAENLKKAIEVPINHHGTEVSVGVSIGIGRYPDHGATPEDLMSQADEAMYAAKSAGKGQIVTLPASQKPVATGN